MANDRMYIRCKGCGDLHYLAKCYDDGYFTTHEGEELRQGLDDFFDRHKWCYRDKYYGGFELVYESDEDAENEDEDERIRKLLIWQVHRNIEDETNDLAQSVYDGIKGHDPDLEESIEDWKKCLAYLEKQKEQKNTSASTMAPSCWEVEQKEQKPVEPSDDELQRYQDELYDFKVFATKQAKEHHISFVHDFEWNNFCAGLLSYFNEQKPAECIEDSVKFEEGFKAGRESGLRDEQKYVLNNLDSYGLCKPAELSEEEFSKTISLVYKAIRKALASLAVYAEDEALLDSKEETLRYYSQCCAEQIFKSLRPSWKPSEHQMNILKAVKEYVGRGSGYWGEGLG